MWTTPFPLWTKSVTVTQSQSLLEGFSIPSPSPSWFACLPQHGMSLLVLILWRGQVYRSQSGSCLCPNAKAGEVSTKWNYHLVCLSPFVVCCFSTVRYTVALSARYLSWNTNFPCFPLYFTFTPLWFTIPIPVRLHLQLQLQSLHIVTLQGT